MSMQQEGQGDWQHGILGCFSDCRLCMLTFLVPCYTAGKNAEHFGEDCLLVGLLVCLGVNPGPIMRWRLRQEKNLSGSMIVDTLVYLLLPCCAMIQEAKEIGWAMPDEVANLGKKKEGGSNSNAGEPQDIDRN